MQHSVAFTLICSLFAMTATTAERSTCPQTEADPESSELCGGGPHVPCTLVILPGACNGQRETLSHVLPSCRSTENDTQCVNQDVICGTTYLCLWDQGMGKCVNDEVVHYSQITAKGTIDCPDTGP